MTFGTTWHNLLDSIEELPSEATLVTPLSRRAFRVTDVQEHRVLIKYRDENEIIPLQRDQFETLHRRMQDSRGEFDLDRLPPNAEPYATVFSISSDFEIDEEMSNVFAGSDGSFKSARQLWKRRNHEYESFVMAHEETMVFRSTDKEGNEEFIWYHGIQEDGPPEGVKLNGVSVRDSRE